MAAAQAVVLAAGATGRSCPRLFADEISVDLRFRRPAREEPSDGRQLLPDYRGFVVHHRSSLKTS